jgi:glycerol-3-phosphate dehydrogenase
MSLSSTSGFIVDSKASPRTTRTTTHATRLPERCDLLIVGGGINGTGIARDAAGRGLSVVLCEKDDLAAHTSSASTKLIHGGLRYLEDLHFALVRKALREREVLLNAAPHIMRPLHFVMPHDEHLRPMWMIRTGLFLYDHLAPRKRLAASRAIDLRKHIAGEPLSRQFTRGFVYSDGWADDARLVVLNALDAIGRGASVLTRTHCARIEAQEGEWIATLGDGGLIRARAVVNATGPWVSRFVAESSPVKARHRVRLVKGSHIVVPKLFAHRFAYIFQNRDRRIVFAIPYEREFTLIGTTDVEYDGEAQHVRIDEQEIAYLCDIANRYFVQQIGVEDVAWSYSGVRPLLDDEATDPASVTRDYVLELDVHPAPLLSVFGGKITTYRKLAESAVDLLARHLGGTSVEGSHQWTRTALLPGGDLPGGSLAVFLRTVERRYPWLPPPMRVRYAQAYGTRIQRVIGDATSMAGMGEELAPQLFAREAEYLCREEFAQTAEDILWRRTKLGLHLRDHSTGQLEDWLSRGRATL